MNYRLTRAVNNFKSFIFNDLFYSSEILALLSDISDFISLENERRGVILPKVSLSRGSWVTH